MIILLFIGALAVLILSHEFGHFIFAKLSGVKVEEFGFGFPPRLFKFKKGETVYSINLIPFGGFVKVFGENSNEKLPRSFASRPKYWRAIILFAGVFFNVVLAWVLLGMVLMVGAPMSVDDSNIEDTSHVIILGVQEDLPAENVGFQPGDRLKKLQSEDERLEVKTIAGVQDFVARHKGQNIAIEYERGKDLLFADITPDPILGVALDKIGIVSLPIHKAIWQASKDTVFLTVAMTKMFGVLIADIFSGGNMAGQVRGPVGIVNMVGDAAGFGFVYVVQFVALLSINLAILNLLPIPALDGGRLLFLGIEAIKRSPVNEKAMQIANGASFIVLILLMLLVTYKDIVRIIVG